MRLALSITFLSILAVGITPAFAQSEITIEAVYGSGAPGCEETVDGCYSPLVSTIEKGGINYGKCRFGSSYIYFRRS